MKKLTVLFLLTLLVITGCGSSRPTDADRALYREAVANIQDTTAIHMDVRFTANYMVDGQKDEEESMEFMMSIIDSDINSKDLSTKTFVMSSTAEDFDYEMTMNFKDNNLYLDFMGVKLIQPMDDDILPGYDIQDILGYQNFVDMFDDSDDALAAMVVNRRENGIDFELKTKKMLETLINAFLQDEAYDEFSLRVKNPQFTIRVSNEGVFDGFFGSIELLDDSSKTDSFQVDVDIDFVATNDAVKFVTPKWDDYIDASKLGA
ncbi:hypothetical protein G7062_05370 [Erysipelothrix sp. HDW6C]|uniref:hypothetical protein n=1 Tax=Erysipelothrix sp. HDW6C TaxID=2714930 RepID=UPI00140A780E|nr:hypothetical protein [Erysipelothrix sp. HDW6C]QIK69761.1 hypothetical protein G7062_05370 [Erysipelothrix sp. HDW6C]